MARYLTLALLLGLGACSTSGKGLGVGNDDVDNNGDDDDDDDFDPDDKDNDGSSVDVDCDDNDPDTHPGAPEICDGKDNDCDDEIPDNEMDLDGNGEIECAEVCQTPIGASTLSSTLPDCEYVPNATGTPFLAQIEWAMTHAMVDNATGQSFPHFTFPEFDGYGGVYQAPAVMQATDDNGDGIVSDEDVPDIAVVMAEADVDVDDAVLRVISGDGTAVHDSVHWESLGGETYAPYHYAGVAMGNFDGDANVEIATTVMAASDGTCYPAYYEVGGNNKIRLERVGDDTHTCDAHAPAFADLDGDNQVELIWGKAVYDGATLTELWTGASSGGRGWYPQYFYSDGYWNSGYHSFAYDMDGDGTDMEIVGGYTVYNNDGSVFCELGSYNGSTWSHGRDGYPAVADIMRFQGDTLGEPEIVISGNTTVAVYHGVPDYDPNGLARCVKIAELSNDPADDPAVSGYPTPAQCDPQKFAFGGPPNIADFDGDGDNEIGVAGSCHYNIFHFDESDNDRFKRYAMVETTDWSSASTGSTVFDFNGDGASEIVFSDEQAVYVWGFDDAPGLDPWERVFDYMVDTNHKSWTVHEYPLVADVDGDGKAEVLVTNSQLLENAAYFGIYALGALDDDWVSARKVWHQHAYYVTNVEDDNTVGYGRPNYAPFTSENYNNFRNQEPGSFGALAAPQLYPVASICQEGCGSIEVAVQVANEARFISATPDVVVSIYGVAVNGSRTLLDSKPIGVFVHPANITQSISFTINGWSQFDHLLAVVDDPNVSGPLGGDGLAKECAEHDNEQTIALTGICP